MKAIKCISIIILITLFNLCYGQDSLKFKRDSSINFQESKIESNKIVFTDTLIRNGIVYNVISADKDVKTISYSKANKVVYVVVPELADGLRSNGKIFVVVAIIVTIFAGIIIYLIRLDKKLTKLEKNHFKS